MLLMLYILLLQLILIFLLGYNMATQDEVLSILTAQQDKITEVQTKLGQISDKIDALPPSTDLQAISDAASANLSGLTGLSASADVILSKLPGATI